MGSGLILLVIVGAWLAVLVPMALRSHDTATSSRSADRFSDAMRVLSRKAGDRRDVLVPRRSSSSLVVSATKSPRAPSAAAAAAFAVAVEADLPAPLPRTAAERRLRTLLVVVGLALLSLGGAMLGLPFALGLHVLCDLLLVAFVVHLRRQAVLRLQREARRPAAPRVARPAAAPARFAGGLGAARPAAARPAAARPAAARIAGIPDRMPARPAPLTVPLPAPAARYEDRMPVASGSSWSPVPVPPPTYVGKAVAPRRQPRVVDLTRPGQWTAALEADDAGLDIFDDGNELEEILDRRRAVNDW